MKAHLYRIDCITKMHVGSGDVNFNIIDKEVEKDPITGLPTIHASGIKGALRDMFSGEEEGVVTYVFGNPATKEKSTCSGAYKFFDAYMLCRPMRACNAGILSIQVTHADIINRFIDITEQFGCKPDFLPAKVADLNFNSNSDRFLSTVNNLHVESERTGCIVPDENIRKLLGTESYAFAESFEGYQLPNIARNKLDNGRSENLWYEEFVPEGTVFYTIICTPDDKINPLLEEKLSGIVQIGGNASIGYGFTRFTKLA